MKRTPSSPRGRRPPLPDGRETAALPPRPPPVGRFAWGGRRRVRMGGRLRRSAPAPASLLSQTRSRKVEMPSVNASDRVRSVSLLPERKRQFAQPSLHPIRLDGLEVLTVHPRRALVGAALGIGVRQNVVAADLVVEDVEAVAGFCLRFRVQRRLQFLNAVRS